MKVILIRHGEPRYDEVLSRNYRVIRNDLGRLTELGVKQAETVSNDPRLKGASLIVSSPYTRSLQTAAIISRLTNIPLTVENDLHEWIPDYNFTFPDKVDTAYHDFMDNRGIEYPNKKVDWESLDSLYNRTKNSLKPYLNYEKIIVVCHGMVMRALYDFDEHVDYCGIREIELNKEDFL